MFIFFRPRSSGILLMPWAAPATVLKTPARTAPSMSRPSMFSRSRSWSVGRSARVFSTMSVKPLAPRRPMGPVAEMFCSVSQALYRLKQ